MRCCDSCAAKPCRTTFTTSSPSCWCRANRTGQARPRIDFVEHYRSARKPRIQPIDRERLTLSGSASSPIPIAPLPIPFACHLKLSTCEPSPHRRVTTRLSTPRHLRRSCYLQPGQLIPRWLRCTPLKNQRNKQAQLLLSLRITGARNNSHDTAT